MTAPPLRSLAPLLLVLALLPAPRAAAQTATSASILGVAAGQEGALPGLEVTVTHAATGAEVRTLTDREGRFRVFGLAPGGPYTLRVRGLGVRESRREGIRLAAGQVLRLDLEITPEAVAIAGLEVHAPGSEQLINPSRTGAATHVDAAQIQAVPTLSRNVMELTDLSPLVRRGEGFSIAGQNERYNALRLDGATIQDLFGLSPTGSPGGRSGARAVPLAAVEQYQVLVSPFEVRHSGFTGGLLNAVTRTGTNQWQGEGFAQRRDQRLVGDFVFDGESVRPVSFLRELYGGWVGGPLQPDRLHLFVAAEVERRRHPTEGISYGDIDPRAFGLSPDSLARLQSILASTYGLDPGQMESFPLENPLANLFARLDWQPRAGQRLSLKVNLTGAEEDISPTRERTVEYGFSSTAYRYEARSRAATLQWNTQLRGGVGNELMVHLQGARESNRPVSELPFVQVDIASHFGSARHERLLELGAHPDAHASRLEQHIVQVSNQLTFGVGDRDLALGVSFDRMAVRHLSGHSSQGFYRFASLQDLEENVPVFFQRQLLDHDPDRLPRLILYQAAGYVQSEWSPLDGLRVQAGVRLDVPILHDKPDENTHVRRTFGVGTTELPTSYAMVSPRVGFNWQRSGALRTQLRGGAGVFAGAPPLAWLAQAYDYTGRQGGWIVCPDSLSAPAFDPAGPLPGACQGEAAGRNAPRQVVIVDRGFRFPQDLRMSAGVDQELPGALIGSLEAVYTYALQQVHVMDLNIGDRREGVLHPQAYPSSLGPREYYGVAVGEGFAPAPVSDRYEQVLLLTNRGRNQSFVLAAELQRALGQAFMLRGAYAYTRSFDTQSLTAADLASSFGRTATAWNPNDPGLRPSRYDQPHKVVFSAAARADHRAGESRLSLVYTAQSGTRYSYVYWNDVNGDGYPGVGNATGERNDLIFVPAIPSDIPTGASHGFAMHRLIEMEPCLERARGRIIERNACSTPMSHALDLRTSHAVRLPGGLRGEITADLINVLNLLDSRWGHVYRVPANVPVLAHVGRVPGAGNFPPVALPEDPLIPFYYVGPLRIGDDGRIWPVRAYTPSFPESQWQAQLGLRVTF
jgi:hypothetical protein